MSTAVTPPAPIRRRLSFMELFGELYKHTIAVLVGGVVVMLIQDGTRALRGSSLTDNFTALASMYVVMVTVGHLLPTAFLRNVSYRRSFIGVLLTWVAWITAWNLPQPGQALVIEGVLFALFVAAPALGLATMMRLTIPALFPRPHLREGKTWPLYGASHTEG